MGFNIKKGMVPGYEHNAPAIRYNSVKGVQNEIDPAPEIKKSKATKYIPYTHNAPELMQQPSGKSVGSLFGR